MVRTENGFALMAVLWILVMVGAVGIAFQADAGAERRAVANARSALRARWAARAGLHQTLYALDSMLVRGRARADSTGDLDMVLPPITLAWPGVSVRAVALDARARLNLNLADAEQLAVVFGAVGVAPVSSAAIAGAVLDWRDPDHRRNANGAEAPAYAVRRLPSVPKNAPFEAVDELRQVLGVTPAVFERVAPYLTVVGDGRINVNAAAPPVLTALPGIDAAAARNLAARRRAFPFRNVFEVIEAVPPAARDRLQAAIGGLTDRAAFGPRTLEVVVQAAVDGSPVRATLRAVVEASGGTVWRVARIVER